MNGPARAPVPFAADLLVVDHDPARAAMIERPLTAAGCAVRFCRDEPAALDALRSHEPDLVLLHRGTTGWPPADLVRDLTAVPNTRRPKIVLVTGEGEGDPSADEIDAIADDRLRLPVRDDELVDKLRALVRIRQLERDLERERARAAQTRGVSLAGDASEDGAIKAVAHDLKNPLTAIGANLDLLDRRIAPEAAHLVKRCRSGVKRLNQMILDLLDIAALEQRRFVLTVGEVDAGAIVRRAVAEAADAAAQRGVTIETASGATECVARADGALVRRVVDHLLAHALDHSPRGATVSIDVVRDGCGVEIRVADRGPGIPESYRERVFDKAARSELKSVGLSANRGLGLTFCRLAVMAQDGTVRLESAPGGGALFRVVLPAGRPSLLETEAGAVL